MPFTQLTPLDDQGLRSSRPANEVKWRTLTNVIARDGALRRRPGFVNPKGVRNENLPDNTQVGTTVVIAEINNPGSSAEGRSGYSYVAETIRPDATGTNNGWFRNDGVTTTNLHLDIDETGTLDAAVIRTPTLGADVAIGFVDPVNSPDITVGRVLRGRARLLAINGTRAGLNFYAGSISDDNLIGTATISVSATDSGTSEWDNIQLQGVWSDDEIIIQYVDGDISGVDMLLPNGNGDDTAWRDAEDLSTASFADFNESPWDLWDAPPAHQLNGVQPDPGPGGLNDKQGFTFPAPNNTFSTINELVLLVGGNKVQLAEPKLDIIYKVGGVEYTLGSNVEISNFDSVYRAFDILAASPLNPATSLAWTTADITSGQFIFKYAGGGQNFVIDQTGLFIGGKLSSAPQVGIDYLAIDILQATADNNADDNVLGKSAIYVTTNNYFKLGTDAFGQAILDVAGGTANITTGPVPLDHTILYGQLYVVNGIDDTRRYPTAGGVFEALSTNLDGANPITGRCVEAFADRIFYGWVNEDGTQTPERIAWSVFQNGGTHNGASAGDADLLDTPGGILALGVITEDTCTAVKEQGVYLLRRTGNSVIPFIRDVIDFHSGIVAPRTFQTVITPDGNTIQLWLGFSPAKGLNVFMFDGSQVRAVGDEIHKELRDDSNPMTIASNSFAEIDPQGAGYWLFVPEGEEILPTNGFFYSLRQGQWYRVTLPYFASCAGRWTIRDDSVTTSLALRGNDNMMIGTGQGIPFKTDYDVTFDVISPGEADDDSILPTDPAEDGIVGRFKEFITSTIETGDLAFAGPDGFPLHVIVHRIYIGYIDRGPFSVNVSASQDGGLTFNTANSFVLGGNADGSYDQFALDVGPLNGRRIRFKLEFEHVETDGASPVNEPFELTEAWVEWEPAGEAP